MRRFRQIIACYLVLCLTFGGAVGISPVLHRLIEHGGQGPAHSHVARFAASASQRHDYEHDHGHAHPHPHSHAEEYDHSRKLFTHEHEFTLPAIHLVGLWHGLIHLLTGDDADSSEPPQDVPNHEHNSLPQMLLSGLIEQHIDVPLVPRVPVTCPVVSCSVETILLARDFDPQTASRPPPRYPELTRVPFAQFKPVH